MARYRYQVKIKLSNGATMHVATATCLKSAKRSARRSVCELGMGVAWQLRRFAMLGDPARLIAQRKRIAAEIHAARAFDVRLCDFMRCNQLLYPTIDGNQVLIIRQ